MSLRIAVPVLSVLTLLLVGCGGVREIVKATGGGQDPFAAPDPYGGIPPELRAGRAGGQVRSRVVMEGDDPAEVASRSPSGPRNTILTPEDEIVWTDPDNPDAALPGLEDVILESKSRGAWEESYTEAKQRSLREGKALMIWFTDSKRSPVCKTLSRELFSTPEFDSWARENIVRLRLDFDVKGDPNAEDQMDAELRKKDYLKKLEKRLNAKGKPHVLVMAPDGTMMGRYRGYRPNSADFFFGQLKHSAILAKKHHDDWVETMEEKGYRTWNNSRGDFRVFAKLLRYWKGELVLVEPDGRRFKTKEQNLSDGDRLWIAGEKARRGH